MLIDVHAHFYTAASPYRDWEQRNERRLEAGRRIGITWHVASVLGTWGARSPVYFPSPPDLEHGNDAMLALCAAHPDAVRGYCTVNPNYPDHALREIERCTAAGMIGIKLAASRRADDPLLDPIAAVAAGRGLPMLHHIWQHRRRDWPGQEASDAGELAALAARHPDAKFILAHLAGGGDWQHSLRALETAPNIWVDLAGSGLDTGMLERALERLGAERLLWGADVTLDTGWARLRRLEALPLPAGALDAIRFGNAVALFPAGSFA